MVDSTKCKVFVVGFNLLGLDQQELTAFLESRPEVQNWRSAVPGQLFVIGSGTARDLASLIRNRFVGEFFFVAPIKPWYCNGCLPREAWNFIVNSRSSGGPVGLEVSEGIPRNIDHDGATVWNGQGLSNELVGASR